VQVLDVILFVLLIAGCAMCVPIYWWLFGMPVMRLWRHVRNRTARGM